MIDVILYSRELGGGGHAVVVGGYSELDDGSQLVHVYDPVTTQRKTTRMYCLMMSILVIREYLHMFETIRTSRCGESVLPPWLKHSIAVALLAIIVHSSPAVWGAQFELDKLEKALAAPPQLPQPSQDLVNSFLDRTLPKLMADDARLAHQWGFGDRMSYPVTIDRAFSMMIIRREDVMSLLDPKRKVQPVDLVNNTNNWLETKLAA